MDKIKKTNFRYLWVIPIIAGGLRIITSFIIGVKSIGSLSLIFSDTVILTFIAVWISKIIAKLKKEEI